MEPPCHVYAPTGALEYSLYQVQELQLHYPVQWRSAGHADRQKLTSLIYPVRSLSHLVYACNHRRSLDAVDLRDVIIVTLARVQSRKPVDGQLGLFGTTGANLKGL